MKNFSVKSIKTIICAYSIALTVFLVFVACCNSSTNENNENNVETTTGYSYQLQMDIAMQNAKSPTVLALKSVGLLQFPFFYSLGLIVLFMYSFFFQ